jgi:hypothetical protein
MILELAAGVERDTQEPREFLFTLLSATLDDICRNRKRGPNYLAPECHISRASHTHSDAMGIYRKCVRLLPDVKFLEVCHTTRCDSESGSYQSFDRDSTHSCPAYAIRKAPSQKAAKPTAPCLSKCGCHTHRCDPSPCTPLVSVSRTPAEELPEPPPGSVSSGLRPGSFPRTACKYSQSPTAGRRTIHSQ